MLKIILAVALCAGAAGQVFGAAVTAQADDDNGFSGSAAGDLPVNNLIRVGTFDIPDSTISQNSTNPTFLNSHFFEFGTARVGQNVGAPGHFDQTISNPNSNALGFANKQIYLWLFNSTDNSSNASSFTTAFEQGVFYLDMTVPDPAASNWRFRDHDEIPNNSTVDISDLTVLAGPTLAPGARVVIGLFPHGTSTLTGAPNFGLVPIPEPSATLFCGLAVVAMMNRRRPVV